MKKRSARLFAALLLAVNFLAACSYEQPQTDPTFILQSTTVTDTPVAVVVVDTPVPAPTPLPAQETAQPTEIPVYAPACYLDPLPQVFEYSAAIEGWKLFATPRNIISHYIYFPSTCSVESMEQDVNALFFGRLIPQNDIAIVLLDPIYEGTVGKLYYHLNNYAFWGMGPEDYPMVIDRNQYVNPNIIIYRTDRINGEGTEGNAILSMMQSTAEHEYIHTVQGSNNPDLAQLLWSDGVYRAFIERYANLYNNSGMRYYQAAPTIMALLQFLDGMSTRGLLEGKVTEILAAQAINADAFLTRDIRIYNDNLKAQVTSLGGTAYLDTLSSGRFNPLLLVSLAGCADIQAYDMLRRLYDENVLGYNQWYYGTDTQQYLPATFDQLFQPAT